MATAVSVDSVSTPDAVPASSPFKISSLSGENQATVKWTPTTSDASPLGCWRIVFNGTNRGNGTKMASLGAVCGLDRCGAPGVMPLSLAQNVQQTIALTYTETGGPADGDYNVAVFACSDTQGWST